MVPNKKLVKCSKLTDLNEYIDETSMCGSDVEFDLEPELGPKVTIGHGSEFGFNLEIGQGSMIGNFVVGEDGVILGKFVCVESKSFLKASLKIADYAMVRPKENSKGGKLVQIVKAKSDSKYVLVDGKCELQKR